MKKAVVKKKSKKRFVKYRPKFAIDAFELLSEGMSLPQVARTLGFTTDRLKRWEGKYPSFRYAIKKAKKVLASRGKSSIEDFVVSRLTPELQEIWDRLNQIEESPNAIERAEALLERKGLRVRQYMFLHALFRTAFDLNTACHKAGVTIGKVRNWLETDPEFPLIFQHIQECKKAWAESALLQKVDEGDTKAILFVNERLNRKPGLLHEGYGNQATVEVHQSGTINHQVQATVTLEDLNLPREVRLAILKAYERKEKELEQEQVNQEFSIPNTNGKQKLLASPKEK